MAKLFTITEDWTEQKWFSTGGTRPKKYLQDPDGKFYYFKRSQIKTGKDYRYEFWNEIIAYELGTMLGFNMLRYDIALDGDIMGCICESMIDSEQEEFIEGVKYLQAYSPDYDPAKKEHQKWYTFDLIEKALKAAKIDQFINDIIKVIIFDALIDNGDRHQENWAIITHQKKIIESFHERENLGFLKNRQKKIALWFNRNLKKNENLILKPFYKEERRFAPIYDSGSSLGRELMDEKVNLFLNAPAELNRYIERGVSEIHWDTAKVNHFELIDNLLESSYEKTTNKIINDVIKKFDVSRFAEVVRNIDYEVPEAFDIYKIPDNRKQLIIKLITLRFEKLKPLIYERI